MTTCSACGTENDPNANFCDHCGKELRAGVPRAQHAPAAPNSTETPAGVWVGLSVLFALIALFFLPPVFGALGIFFGYKAKQAGMEGAGIALMVVNGVFMLVGMILGALSSIYW